MENLDITIKLLKEECKKYKNPIVTEIADLTQSPFKVLISCLLSLRTKDAVTTLASKRLFEKADSPEKLLNLDIQSIEKLIYPVGFYKTKAKRLKVICKDLIEIHNGKVPDNEQDLLKLKGVGRKTMGIVMCYAFGKNDHIPVDSHVHEISNRIGWVKTKTPNETEIALTKIIPKKYWHDLNDLLVNYGQNICVPVSPYCSKCKINKYCKKVNVKYSR
ncbi:endonuclease III [Candidatus Woesearchaeota archaeon]|nr:endonuclease III [Candidatus Woesearchaeota archaeon]HLD10723.1 endonuclease III [Candidatus Nanoarchaeia archaeon]